MDGKEDTKTGVQPENEALGLGNWQNGKEVPSGEPFTPQKKAISSEKKATLPLCTRKIRSKKCRACTPLASCEPATFSSHQTQAEINPRKEIFTRSILDNAKLRNFEYFRGLNESEILPTPHEWAHSCQVRSKRRLFRPSELANTPDEPNGKENEKERPQSSRKKAKTEAKTEEKTPFAPTIGVSYLEGAYPYGEYLTDEPSLRDIKGDSDGSDSDDTIPEGFVGEICGFGCPGEGVKHHVGSCADFTEQNVIKPYYSYADCISRPYGAVRERCTKCKRVYRKRSKAIEPLRHVEYVACKSKKCDEGFIRWNDREVYPLRCPECRWYTVVRRSRSSANPEKRFFSCPNGKCRIRFVAWYELDPNREPASPSSDDFWDTYKYRSLHEMCGL